MNFREFLTSPVIIMDGSTGTLLQRQGLQPSEGTESWNLLHPEIVSSIHKAYFDAGSNLVATNTFGASARKYTDQAELERIIRAAWENAARARDESSGTQEKFIAFNIGPCGTWLEPYGDLEFDDAVELFARGVRVGAACGADAVMIETMMTIEEAEAAVTAVKENSDLPIIVSHTYDRNGRLMSGAKPEDVVRAMERCGADAVGVNCSFGPELLRETAREYLAHAAIPVSFKPNAGLPTGPSVSEDAYAVDAASFAQTVAGMVTEGVRLAGGCCGTSPAYIRALTEALA